MTATILDISNGGWSAIAAWVGLLLAVIAARYAWSQYSAARQTRDEQAQPYVAIYMEPTEADRNAVDLIVKNFGATAARDIAITIEPPLQSSLNAEVDKVNVPSVIRTLVPGQQWSTFWDTTFHREDRGLPTHHTATIEFKDSRNRTLGPYTFDLDWDAILGRGYIVTYGMHQLAVAVREIRDLLKGWRTPGADALRVLAYSGEEHDRQRQEHFQQRIREQQEREQQDSEDEPGSSSS
jgi:hypothetical protein